MASSTDQKHTSKDTPYDAPLSFREPSWLWTRTQADRGRNGTKLEVDKILPNVDLSGKWVLLTGANSGIGREACLQFATWGASIVLGCRSNPPPHEPHPDEVIEECKTRARAAGHEKAEFEWWEIDMTVLESVKKFGQRWLDTKRSLDILCNNAGVGSSKGGDQVFRTDDGFEIVHQVNFLSHVLLTLTILPSLAAAPAPRIICTVSCMQFFGKFDLSNFNAEIVQIPIKDDGLQFYSNNKLWFQVWLCELQQRLLQHDQYRHITVNGVHPGYVNSGIWNLNAPRPWLQPFLKFLAYFLAVDAQQGSLAITHAATSIDAGPDPTTQGVGDPQGKGGARYFNRIWEAAPMPHAKDADCRNRVWRKVDDELKLKDRGLLETLGQ